ncbi:MAG: hypothetical protein DRJ97_06005 [Thermoprotei archaeon]|nr:MAG: hypothetical protein DRJ97_06005 [Thermoprotei archaeon]
MRLSLAVLAALILLLPLALSLRCAWLFAAALMALAAAAACWAFKGFHPLGFFSVLVLCFSARLYPYLEGLPLGVDPIRDLAYACAIGWAGSLNVKPPINTVKYYTFSLQPS